VAAGVRIRDTTPKRATSELGFQLLKPPDSASVVDQLVYTLAMDSMRDYWRYAREEDSELLCNLKDDSYLDSD
jgi:hypothetical protein